ncbi:hypothetical protein J6590_095746, partial [Homalodisca vitripennis]
MFYQHNVLWNGCRKCLREVKRGIVRVGLELTSHICHAASATNGRCPKLAFRMVYLFSGHVPTFHREPSVID